MGAARPVGIWGEPTTPKRFSTDEVSIPRNVEGSTRINDSGGMNGMVRGAARPQKRVWCVWEERRRRSEGCVSARRPDVFGSGLRAHVTRVRSDFQGLIDRNGGKAIRLSAEQRQGSSNSAGRSKSPDRGGYARGMLPTVWNGWWPAKEGAREVFVRLQDASGGCWV